MFILWFISLCESLVKCPSGSLRKAVPEYLGLGIRVTRQDGIRSIFEFISFASFLGGVP